MMPGHIAVIDIGKTNAKLALVDPADLSEVAVVTRPNKVLPGPPYPHFDVEAIWAFLMDALSRFQRQHGIGTLCVTTHGASGALLAADGTLAAPILDYEHSGPDAVAADYDRLRPDFGETGSPRLSAGLNLGAQIHWQFARDPSLRARTAAIVTYPQYWGHRLTGALACDVSSLGAHTDLWDPHARRVSSLVARLGIEAKLAPPRLPSDRLGRILPQIAERTGLDPETQVTCGIHDSNASLLPHVLRQAPPYSVVSTGTWVIVMTVGGDAAALDPARDTLINVNALGAPVPSARFMGGREYDLIRNGQPARYDDATLERVAEHGPFLLPSVVTESGPFQGKTHRWLGQEPAEGSPDRAAALGFYLALMTAQSLSLTQHSGPIIVEGPFAANTGYCAMLSAATGCRVNAAAGVTGTSQGAALLALGPAAPPVSAEVVQYTPDGSAQYKAYAERWKDASTRL